MRKRQGARTSLLIRLVFSFAFLFLLVAPASRAAGPDVDLSGRWAADSGRVIDALGKSTPCSRVELTMEQAPGKLTTKRYRANCQALNTDWGPDHMTLSGADVLNLDGDKIGTFQGAQLLTSEPQSGVVYTFNLTLKPASAMSPETLESSYGAKNWVGTMIIESTLKKVP